MKLMPHQIQIQENDTRFNWGIEAVKAKEMWGQGIFGEGSIVAVIDTGCDTDHEHLSENIIGGANFTDDYSSQFDKYDDNNGHGTHVSGIIAANNVNYEIGIAPRAKLLILKTMKYNGSGSILSLIRALYYAVSWRGEKNEKVDIVCLSLGTKTDNPLLKEAVNYLVSKNILVVVASGNEGDGSLKEEYMYPGYYNGVIQVGSVDENLSPSAYSNNNNQLDVVAPGRNIFSTFPNNEYRVMSGTSMAAPFIAGALALIIEMSKKKFNRQLTEPELYAQLIKSTNLMEFSPSYTGNGIVDFSKTFK
jgi:major intracellular serine protease